MTEPRMPERTRILRPSLWIDATVAMLSDAAFRLYLGLTTCADDEGWTLWRPATLAAHLLRFRSTSRRESALEKGAAELVDVGLLVLQDCGCAHLPYLRRDFRVGGGNHAETIRDFHRSHVGPDEYVQVRTSPASMSGSSSVLGSALPSSSAPVWGRTLGKYDRSNSQQKKNDDPWKGWNPLWEPIRDAMARRGFLLPPTGGQDEENTQRDSLWQMVRENADLVAEFMDEAPAELRAGQGTYFDLLGYVFTRWNLTARGGGV